jgi:hypothetical protein
LSDLNDEPAGRFFKITAPSLGVQIYESIRRIYESFRINSVRVRVENFLSILLTLFSKSVFESNRGGPRFR